MLCLSRGPYHLPCAGYHEILFLKNLGALSAVDFPGLGRQLAEPQVAAEVFPCQRLLLLCWRVTPWSQPGDGCPCASQAMPTAPREQAEPGHISASALSSTRAVVPKRSKIRGLWRYTLMARLDAHSVGLHLIMKCMCWGLFVSFI